MKNGSKRKGRTLRRGNGTGTLYRKPGGNVWYMRFPERNPDTGKIKHVAKSTGTADRDEAKRILDERVTRYGYGTQYTEAEHAAKVYSVLQGERAKIEQHEAELQREAEERAKAEREAAERAAAEERDRNAATFAEAFCLFRDSTDRDQNISDRALDEYEAQYNLFAKWVKEYDWGKHKLPAVTKLRDFSRKHADRFIKDFLAGKSGSTQKKYLTLLKNIWGVLRCEEENQVRDPWYHKKVLSPEIGQVTHRDLTLDQLAAVAAVFNSTEPVPGYKIKDVFRFGDTDIRDELRALFAVGLFTGARLGDATTIKWDSIDTAARTWTYEPRKTSRKYHRRVTCAIHPTLEKILAALPTFTSRSDYCLPTLADLYLNKEPSMLTNRVQAIFRAAGIETTAEGENGTRTRTLIGFHSCRHFFNSWLNNHGVNHAVTDYLVCHEQGKVTATYYHENRAAIRAAILTLPPLPSFTGDPAAIDAPQADAQLDATTCQAEATDAPQGVLEALRDLLAKMSDSDLKAAAKIIRTEAKNRG